VIDLENELKKEKDAREKFETETRAEIAMLARANVQLDRQLTDLESRVRNDQQSHGAASKSGCSDQGVGLKETSTGAYAAEAFTPAAYPPSACVTAADSPAESPHRARTSRGMHAVLRPKASNEAIRPVGWGRLSAS
jgi:hypothetical protein